MKLQKSICRKVLVLADLSAEVTEAIGGWLGCIPPVIHRFPLSDGQASCSRFCLLATFEKVPDSRRWDREGKHLFFLHNRCFLLPFPGFPAPHRRPRFYGWPYLPLGDNNSSGNQGKNAGGCRQKAFFLEGV